MALMGVGIGLVVAQIVNLTISQVREDQRNEGSGTHNTFRELGGSLGTALIGAVLLVGAFSGFTDGALKAENIQLPPNEREALSVEVEDAMNQVSEDDQKKLVDSLTPEQQQQLGDIVSKALVDAQRSAVLWTAGVVLIAALIGTFLPGRRREDEPVEPGPKAALK